MEHLTVTWFCAYRGFLHIYGHKKPEVLDRLNAKIYSCMSFIKKIAAPEKLYPNPKFDTIYFVLSVDGRYHRCTIREKRPNSKAIIDLIDYGYDVEANTTCLYELDPEIENSGFLEEFPPIAIKYVLANFVCTRNTDKFSEIKSILSRGTTLRIVNEQTGRGIQFISLNINDSDLAARFIGLGIGEKIEFTEQREEMHRRNKRWHNVIGDHLAGTEPSLIPSFRAKQLKVGPFQFHAVYCTFIEDGPNLFWCLFKSEMDELDRMTLELANSVRSPITTKLVSGQACLAQYPKDLVLYRAVIKNIQPEGCCVTFIDYGNSEYVPYTALYEIPSKFLKPEAFASPFQLHGRKKLNLKNKRLLNCFELIVGGQLDLKMMESNNINVQQCELYEANGKSILELLKDADELKMSELSTCPVAPNIKDMVVIRTLNARKFYVLRHQEFPKFERMMEYLFQLCMWRPQPKKLPTKGKFCAATVHDDCSKWYGAIVLNVLDPKHVQVKFVDFGIDLICDISDSKLRELATRFLKMPQQAIECCLPVANISEIESSSLALIDVQQQTKTRTVNVDTPAECDTVQSINAQFPKSDNLEYFPAEVLIQIYLTLKDKDLLHLSHTSCRFEKIACIVFKDKYADEYFVLDGESNQEMYEDMFSLFAQDAGLKAVEVKNMKDIAENHWTIQLLRQYTNHLQKLKLIQSSFKDIHKVLSEHLSVKHLSLRFATTRKGAPLPEFMNLEKFEVTYVRGYIFMDFENTIKNSPELKSLTLKSFFSGFTFYHALETIWNNSMHLRDLRLNLPVDNTQISNEHLNLLTDLLKNLQTLELKITNGQLELIQRLGLACKQLNHLSLEWDRKNSFRNEMFDALGRFTTIKRLELRQDKYNAPVATQAHNIFKMNFFIFSLNFVGIRDQSGP